MQGVPAEPEPSANGAKTYREYYKQRWGFEGSPPGHPLIKATHARKASTSKLSLGGTKWREFFEMKRRSVKLVLFEGRTIFSYFFYETRAQ